MPNSLLKVALPAVELPKNRTSTLLVTVALPAVEVAPNFKPALLVKLALPAVALSPKVMSPVLVKCVKLPAVALFRKFITVGPETKFWVIPELFVMPTPLMVNEKKGLVIVNALAPGLNTMPLTSVVAEMTGRLILEVANVAVSAGPIGRAIGHPVGRAVPVRIGRSCLPGGAPGEAAARCCKKERQNGGGRGKEDPHTQAQE